MLYFDRRIRRTEPAIHAGQIAGEHDDCYGNDAAKNPAHDRFVRIARKEGMDALLDRGRELHGRTPIWCAARTTAE